MGLACNFKMRLLTNFKSYYLGRFRYVQPQKILYNKFSGFTQSAKSTEGNHLVCKTIRREFRSRSRRSLTPIDEVSGEISGFRGLLRPFGFTLLVSGCSFCGASIWQYESLRRLVQESRKSARNHTTKFFGKAGSFRHHINLYWNNLTPGRKVVAGIIGANVAVFLMWKVPALTPLMLKYFSSSPMSGAPCWSLFFSTFSHYSAFHLLANMYVLWSFSNPICNLLGREQFLATYITAGMVSGFASYVYKVARMSMVPSLGASGAIMAILGAVCCQYPDSELSIAFIGDIFPHSFSASSAMKTLIVFDTLGILLRWRFFDHAAHLGGMVFGIWYINYGYKLIWINRESLMRKWHEWRGRP